MKVDNGHITLKRITREKKLIKIVMALCMIMLLVKTVMCTKEDAIVSIDENGNENVELTEKNANPVITEQPKSVMKNQPENKEDSEINRCADCCPCAICVGIACIACYVICPV